MADVPQIVLPHGGFRKLVAYKKSEVVFLGTGLFCDRFFPKFGDRTVDQMKQAARSCKQNISEGSSASGTSKETELKLTNVARASLEELLEDYLDYLKLHGESEWPANDERRIKARELGKVHDDWEFWKPLLESRPAEVVANLMIVIIYQTRYLLDRMIAHLEEDFKNHGGIRERMHAARTAVRGESWDKAIYSRLDGAANAEELAERLCEIKRQAEKTAWGIRKRKGWL